MNIDRDAVKLELVKLLHANMEGELEGGEIVVDSSGALVDSAAGSGGWRHTLMQVKCTDEEFHLLVNPRLAFRQEIDLMDDEIPDTVEEAVDFLWEDINAGIDEYVSCF